MLEADARVVIEQCWGCNVLRIPKPWTVATLPLLRAERRLVIREFLCNRSDCPAEQIANPKGRGSARS